MRHLVDQWMENNNKKEILTIVTLAVLLEFQSANSFLALLAAAIFCKRQKGKQLPKLSA